MSQAAPQTTRGGSDDGGFSITCAPGSAELSLQCWGFGAPEVAAAFARAFLPVCESAALSLNVVLDTICVYKLCLYLPDGELKLSVNCTNVRRVEGTWKLVHHHPDQAPADWQAAIGRMVEAGNC